MKKIFTLLFSVLSLSAISQSTTVVISQVYGGGGATSGATYLYDYVELHNVSNVTQDISGFSIQYGSATGNFASTGSNLYAFPASTTIAAGKYLLIQCGSIGSVGNAITPTPDIVTGNLSMSASSGKVALSNAAVALGCGSATGTLCTYPNAAIIDVVAYGSANNGEGSTSANNGVVLANNQAAVRKVSGCQDTNNNNNDFDVITDPVPRNSASTGVNCTTLPLNLTTFKAIMDGGKVSLSWNSVNEVNVKGFSVEKSLNGIKFSEISFVNANNRSTNSYSSNDENVKAGVNYYRLKMIDLDGSYRYSNIVTVSRKSEIFVDVFPNPVVNSITVRHDKSLNKANITVVTMDGRQVKTVPVEAGAIQTSFSLSELVKGNYMVIFSNNGEKSVVKFSKQ